MKPLTLELYLHNLNRLANHVEWLRANAAEVVRRANDYQAGLAGISYDRQPAGKGGDAVTFRVLEQADKLARDPATNRAKQLVGAIANANGQLQAAERTARWFLPMSDDERQRALKPANAAGECVNCTTWVVNQGTERLRAGRCPACATYRSRHNGEERPRHLWAPATTENPATTT